MARDQKTKRLVDQLNQDTAENYMSLVAGGTTGNFVALDADGDAVDSTYDETSFLTTATHDVAARHDISGDGTKSRVLRQIQLTMDDGTNANTLKCTVASLWNGDTIAVTDNVAKGATTGNFTLNAGGTELLVEAAGLSGNCVMAQGGVADNPSTTTLNGYNIKAGSNDILITLSNNAGVDQDLTALVDAGAPLELYILYLTDA
jgi:hypothetical protein